MNTRKKYIIVKNLTGKKQSDKYCYFQSSNEQLLNRKKRKEKENLCLRGRVKTIVKSDHVQISYQLGMGRITEKSALLTHRNRVCLKQSLNQQNRGLVTALCHQASKR